MKITRWVHKKGKLENRLMYAGHFWKCYLCQNYRNQMCSIYDPPQKEHMFRYIEPKPSLEPLWITLMVLFKRKDGNPFSKLDLYLFSKIWEYTYNEYGFKSDCAIIDFKKCGHFVHYHCAVRWTTTLKSCDHLTDDNEYEIVPYTQTQIFVGIN